MTHTPECLRAAEAFLREAVFRSRAKQAAQTFLAKPDRALGSCGLGHEAAVVLDLSSEGEALFRALWPNGLDEAVLGKVHGVLAEWVIEQDALDRKRNHFLKAFRHKHGLDRRAYSGALESEFASGLDALARAEDAARGEHAERMLDVASSSISDSPQR